MEDEEAQHQQELRMAVWQLVTKIAQREAETLGKSLSADFIGSLAEITYTQLETMAIDLEAFAKHAKRSTITMEDVKLCARRNDSLHELISEAALDISRKHSREPLRKKRQ